MSPALSSHPTQPTPPPLGLTPRHHFAYYTLTQRWPRVIAQIQHDHPWPTPIAAVLNHLAAALPQGPVLPLTDSGPDCALWHEWLAPWLGQPWLTLPWFIAETYFYRQILAATNYYGDGPKAGRDPYASVKQTALTQAIATLYPLGRQLQTWQASARHSPIPWSEALMTTLLHAALWGNQADLSLHPGPLLPAEQAAGATTNPRQSLVVDDTTTVLADWVTRDRDRWDIITDNTGGELITDLFLAYGLLLSGRAGRVVLHVKAHPTFVSDATIADVEATLQALQTAASSHPDAAHLRAIAWELDAYRDRGQLQCQAHPFWTSPLAGWDLPPDLRHEVATASWVIVKGDANYRRLLGDRTWKFTTPWAAIVDYWPTRLLALRTLKSPLVLGLSPQQLHHLFAQDPQWLTTGRWGLIQSHSTPLSGSLPESRSSPLY